MTKRAQKRRNEGRRGMDYSDGRGQPRSEPNGLTTIALRVLETTDLHGHIHGYDYFADHPCPATGFARIATLIERARSEAQNVLLFDNGDFLQGTPLTQYWGTKRGLRPAETHPMIAAMNLAHYDAGTLGNHEFDYGLDYLEQVIAGATFPMVCANMWRSAGVGSEAQGAHLIAPWTVLNRDFIDQNGSAHRLRIGVIGVLPPQTALWAREPIGGRARTACMVETLRTELPRLRTQNVDLVIALAHTGIATPDKAGPPGEPPEQAALEIAALDGIDVILCGHTHECFPSPELPASAGIDPIRGALHGKPAISAGRWGSHLGVIDLRLEKATGESWKIAGFQTDLRPIREGGPSHAPSAPLPEAPGILTAVAPAHIETLTHIRRQVGTLASPLQSYFSMVAPDAGLTLVADAQRNHARERLRGTQWAELPILSAVAPFKSGGRGGPGFYIDIPAGPLTISHIDDLYVYPNLTTALEVTGAQVMDWLEHSAGAFTTLQPGHADQPLLDPDFPSYNFDVIDGLTYEIDPSHPPRYSPTGRQLSRSARRVRNLRHCGAPVTPEDRFVIVTNSYRSAGAGCFLPVGMPTIPLGRPRLSRDVLIDEVTRRVQVSPVPRETWRLRGFPETSAVFTTSPRALDHLDGLAGITLEPLELLPSGFQRIRLHLDPLPG